MPAGNDQPASLVWQPIPGADGAALYPLIRKIDTISSNTYLIATADALILIDPGGIPDQVEAFSKIIQTCREEKDRPVFVFLTHAHIDHFIGVQSVPAFAHAKAVIFAVQEAGAVALEGGDGGITQGTLLNVPITPMNIALPLLTCNRSSCQGIPGHLAFPNGAEITITRDTLGDAPITLDREIIRFGPGPELVVYHTPGHSPDSICIRMGSHLFCGDLLFAASPGIAGLTGWSQECLVRSLTGIGSLLSHGGITRVCPGHGRAISSPDAIRMADAVRKDALALDDIAELNCERAAWAAEFAEDSMEQVNELFTVMAGRLFYVSYVMDELGESDLAEKTTSLMREDVVDELLLAFRDFAGEHHQRGDTVSMHLALKAGQVMAKLQRSFAQDDLARIIDPDLALRASRLLSDYTTTLRGFTPPCEIAVCEIRSLAEALVTGLAVPACTDEDLLSSSDDEEAFTRILLSRIGTRPILEDVEVVFHAENPEFNALVDRDRLTDLLTYIVEDLVGTMTGQIRIELVNREDTVTLTFSGDVPRGGVSYEPRTARFLKGLAQRAGGSLVIRSDGGMHMFEITVAAVL